MERRTFTFNFKLAFMLSFILAGKVFGTTYFVSPSGNDANNGRTQAAAFKTLQFAVSKVLAGDSVLVLDGTYKGFDLRKAGTATDPIVFKALSTNAIISTPTSTNDGINVENAGWVVIEGFKVNNQPRNGIRIVTSNHVTVRNNSCDANYERGILTGFTDDILIENNICTNSIDEHGIYVSNSSDRAIIRNNICHHNNASGIQINADASMGGDGISSDAIIEGNIIYENGRAGGAAINLDGAVNTRIYNNLLYNNHASGIALFQIDAASGSKNCKIFNNTIVHPSDARWAILINGGSSGANLYNNIIINQHSFRGSISIEPSSVAGFLSNYNILVNRLSNDDGETNMTLAQWQALGYDKNSLLASALTNIFVDPGTGNYHLKEASQAIDKGTSLVSSIVTEDLDNKVRPAGAGYDIGAYESAGTITPPPPPPTPANAYYVSPTGNDSNNGRTQSTAFLTLQRAVTAVKAGDTVLVLNGTYKGFDLRKSGTSAARIVFKATSNSAVINTPTGTNDGINVENANWVVIDGFKVNNQPRNGIRVVTSSNVVLKNNSCDGNSRRGILTGFTNDILIENNLCINTAVEHGIYVSNSSDRAIIRNNICHHNNGSGIQINADLSSGGDGISSDAIIEGNIIYENGRGGGAAINLDGSVNTKIYNNLLYNNHATGIALFKIDGATGSKDARIFNNTIVHPSDGRWAILINGGSTGANLYNNIIINQHSFRGSISIESSSSAGFVSNYNILVNRLSNNNGSTNMTLAQWQALGYDKNSVLATSLTSIFVDPATANYRLKLGSQAIDKGTPLVSSIVKEDLDDKVRPSGAAYDIGAYEFSSAAVSAITVMPEVVVAKPTAAVNQLYPNPSSGDYLYLTYEAIQSEQVKILVIDRAGGKRIEQMYQVNAGSNALTVNVQNLRDEIYFVQIVSKSRNEVKKLTIKR